MEFSKQEYWSGVPLPSPLANSTDCLIGYSVLRKRTVLLILQQKTLMRWTLRCSEHSPKFPPLCHPGETELSGAAPWPTVAQLQL